MRHLKMLLFTLICLMSVVPGALASDYPDKPVQLIIGFQPGGSVDIMARVLAKDLGDIFGMPVIVVNKPGGGGNVGAAFVKNAAADGYTVGVSIDTPFDFAPYVQGGSVNYTMDDFKYLGIFAQFQPAFVALANSPYNSFKDVVEAAKSGKELRYGSMTPEEKLPVMAYAKANNLKLLPVPMKGGSDIMTAILGGHVDFGYSGGIHYSYAKAGKMKVLAASGAERLEDFPDVPTLQEQGVPLDCTTKLIAMVPAGTPDDIVQKLDEAFKKAASSPAYADLLKNNLHVKLEIGDSLAAKKYVESRKAYYVNLKL